VARRAKRLENAPGDAGKIVQKAWENLPLAHRSLLESIGASQWKIVTRPLGGAADDFLRSAGHQGLSGAAQARLDAALAVWIKQLRIVLINEHHPKLTGLDTAAREQFIAYLAWHEWGHALSIERCTSEDVAAGSKLLDLAPPGVREVIRTAGYRKADYTHEVVAETYAMLMTRRLREGSGQPPWLDDEIYNRLVRMTEWNE
jgi:hypothetical protein